MNMIGENDDSKLYVEFFQAAEQSVFQSEEKGYPVFIDKVFCKIIIPGDTQQVSVKEVKNDELKKRFPQQWAAFQQGIETPVSGLPIEEWAGITRGQAETLRAQKFRTVEHIASASDSQIQRLMGGYELRAKAQAFLKSANDNAAVLKQAAENERMQKRIAELEDQIKQIATRRKVKNGTIGDSADDMQ
jgi:hypothetical protein